MDGGGRGHALVDQLDPQVRLQQRGQLGAELDLGRVRLAIGHQQLVDGVHQLLLAGAVELLEDLETAQLEPAVHELVAVLVVGHGFSEKVGHLQVDGLEDFVEMRGVLGHQLALCRRGQACRALAHPVLDQPPDVGADEHLLRQVEVTVDMAEGRQIENDCTHLPVGYDGIGIQFQHGGAIVAWVPHGWGLHGDFGVTAGRPDQIVHRPRASRRSDSERRQGSVA